MIAPRPGREPALAVLQRTLLRYAIDTSSFVNRIELF
jgi:hypothetical protein